MAGAVDMPVLNLLSDRDHPLQALADLLTVKQLLGRLEGARIAYVGDADNNVARSLAQACVLVGAELTLASPEGYALADAPDGVRQVVDPAEAVEGAADRLYRRLGLDGPGRRGRGAPGGLRRLSGRRRR